MTHTEKLYALRKEAKEAIITFLKEKEDHKHVIFNLENEDWREDDELFEAYHELPREYYYGKYNYATLYIIHRIYLKDDELYFDGYEDEEGADYTFETGDLFTDTLCAVTDYI
jgi:hypothetical protein